MITKYKNRHNVLFKSIAIAALCLFFVNTICWAAPDSNIAISKNTLATQSVFKPLRDAGIQDSPELLFEILAGIRLLHAGKTPSAVNGILIETHKDANNKRNVEFLQDVERKKGQTIAKFRVTAREGVTFEIKYQDTKTSVLDETNRKASDEVSVADAGLHKTAPLEKLTYGNVFQSDDIITITKIEPVKKIPPALSTGMLTEAALAELRRIIGERSGIITIDGESGAGKTTLAEGLAEKLGIGFVPSGKVFRLAALYIRDKGMGALIKATMSVGEIAQLAEVLKEIEPEKFEYRRQDGEQRYYYDGRDITDELNDPAVTNSSPYMAQIPELRNIIVGQAKAIIEKVKREYKGVIIEGRVTGRELAPAAEFKIFLKGKLNVRAERRARELAGEGWKEILEKTIQDIRARDEIDEHRDIMPLAPASDNYVIDTTFLREEEVLNNALIKLLETLKRSLPEARAGPGRETATAIDLIGFVSPAQPYLSTTHALYTLSGNLKAHFKDSVNVSIYDMYADHAISIDSIVDGITRNRPKVLGLSVVAGTLNPAKELFQKINDRIPEDQRPLIVLGNSVPNYLPETLLREYFPGTLIMQGEGELPLIELIEHVKGQRKLEDVHNLLYLKDGQLMTTPKIEADLSEITSPDMDQIVKFAKQGVEVYIESSRGCPWGKCLFCASRDLLGSRKQERRWRPRDTEQVLREIKILVDNGVEHFNFTDEEFIGPGWDGVKKAQDIATGIIDICKKTGKKVSFTFACRADSIWEDDDERDNPDLGKERIKAFRLLKEAGVRSVFLGVESGSQSQLDRYNKGLKIAESENAIKILKQLGIGFEIGFIMFDPEVTLKEVEENLSFLERNDLLMKTSWFLNTLRLSAGTPFANLYKRKPEFNVPKTPDHNTLQYSYSFKEKSIERLEKLTHDSFGDIHRLYYFLKYLKRSDINPEEFDTYNRYRKILLQLDMQYFRKFLEIEQDTAIPEEKKIFALYDTATNLLSEQVKFAEDLIEALKAAGNTEATIPKEVLGLAGAFIERARKSRSSEQIVEAILRTDTNGAVELIKPGISKGDAADLNETIFIIKPGGTFNGVLIRDILKRIRKSGYSVDGVKVFSGEEIKRGNIFERVYEFPFSVARKGEGLFTKDDRERMNKIYNKPECQDYFGIPIEEAKIIPAYDLTEKYGLSEEAVIDLWTAAYREEIFMNGDYRGINKIGPCKYVLMTKHPQVENGKPFLLVNGLLMQMKSLSEAKGEKTIVFLLRGAKGKSDTWKDMREKFMGDRSPLHSPVGSIRYDAFKGRIAVTKEVPFWKNISHMSSGPLEALREEVLWFDLSVNQTSFGKVLLDNGYTLEEINYFLKNPDVKISGVRKPIFDWVEKMDSYEAFSFIHKVFPPFYNDKAMPTMTFEEYMKYKALHDEGLLGVTTNKVDAGRITNTSTEVKKVPRLGTPESISYAGTGNSLIKAGKVAQVLLSGGTAGRFFGYDVPEHLRVKFLAAAYEFMGRIRTFAELKIANNLWSARQADGKIPIWVMTSALSDRGIKDFLKEHRYFGFSDSAMHFYAEGEIPRMNPTRQDLKAAFPDKPDEWIEERIIENGGEGGIFRYADGSISKKPVGHLDAITSLFISRELLVMLDKGIEYISFSDATNLGTNIDPAILGMFTRSDKDVLHVLAYKNTIFDIQLDGKDGKYIALLRDGALVYSSLPPDLIPSIEGDKITRITNKATGHEVKAKIVGKLERGGTLVDLEGKPQIVEGFRFPDNYDQGSIPYFSSVHQLIKADAILKLFGMDVETYRKASKEQLLERLSNFNVKVNTYVEVKKVIDNDLGRNRIAVQFSRISGDLTSILPTEYVLVDRDGKDTQCAFIPTKEREDLEINKVPAQNALTGRLLLQDRPAIHARDRRRLLENENKDEKLLLLKSSKYLTGYPVNMSIDLTTIPRGGLAEEQLEQNMETFARLIAWHNTFGLNVRYILEHDTDNAYKDRALGILKNKLTKLGSIPGVDVNELLLRVGPPHAGNDVIEISLKSLEAIKAVKLIPDKTYCIALKDDKKISGIAMPNYSAAANMGLSLAALRIAKEKEIDKYDELRGKVLKIFESIYKRYGVLSNENKFTADELELMVTGGSDTRLYYAILYALPPIIKAAIEELKKYHEALHLILQSA